MIRIAGVLAMTAVVICGVGSALAADPMKDKEAKPTIGERLTKDAVSPVYEGMFKEEMDAAALRHPDVGYEPQLIDATLALLMKIDGEQYVVRGNDGKLIRMHVDKSTKLDKVVEGDKVKAYMTEEGHTTTLQRQEK